MTNVNEGPEFADDTATRSIDENSAAGTNIGAAVTAGADPEGDTRTYSLTGTDAAKFDIGSSTGQITVKTGNIPDYEAKTSYSVTVNVTDKKAADGTADTAIDDTISVTINVTDVNEPPDAPAAPTVWQNTATPKTKLDVSWTAPDMTGKPAISDYDVQYKKSADSTWTSHSFTGTGTTTTLTGLDEGTEYDVQVMAKNDEGDSAWSGQRQRQHAGRERKLGVPGRYGDAEHSGELGGGDERGGGDHGHRHRGQHAVLLAVGNGREQVQRRAEHGSG